MDVGVHREDGRAAGRLFNVSLTPRTASGA